MVEGSHPASSGLPASEDHAKLDGHAQGGIGRRWDDGGQPLLANRGQGWWLIQARS